MPAQTDAHLTLGGELDRVGDQVHQHLAQPGTVADDAARHRVVDPVRQIHTLFAGGAATQVERIVQACRELERLALQVNLARFQPRKIEDAVDQRQQGFAAGPNDARKLLLSRGQRRLQQQIAHADDRVQRGANLVAHVGQEFGLGPVAGVGGVACSDQLGLGALARRDVAGNAQQAGATPLRVAHGHLDQFVVLNRASLAVDQPVFVHQGRGAGHGHEVGIAVFRAVTLAEQLHCRLADDLLLCQPMLALVRRIGQEVDPVGVLEPDAVGDVVDQRAQHGLPVGQRLLGLRMPGDVGVGSHRSTIGQAAGSDLQGTALACAANIVPDRHVVRRSRIAALDDVGQKSAIVGGVQPAQVFTEIAACLLPQRQLVRGGLALHQFGRQFEQRQRLLVVKHAAAIGGETHDALVDVLQRNRQGVGRAHAVGDVLHRAFIEHRPPVGIGHNAGVFPDPDAFAGLVAVDLRDEIVHFAVCFQQRAERLAPIRLHVPAAGDVVHRRQHLGFRIEAVETNQRRIGPQLATLQAAAVSTQGQPVEEGGEVVVRHGGWLS